MIDSKVLSSLMVCFIGLDFWIGWITLDVCVNRQNSSLCCRVIYEGTQIYPDHESALSIKNKIE